VLSDGVIFFNITKAQDAGVGHGYLRS
jgi:hypothetical protein